MMTMKQLAASHGVDVKRMRWLVLNGYAEPGSSAIESSRKKPFMLLAGEKPAEAAKRLLADFPVITDRQQLYDFRDALIAFDAQDTPLCDDRLLEAVDVLGRVPKVWELRKFVGGTVPHLGAFLARLRSNNLQKNTNVPVTFTTDTNVGAVMEALSVEVEAVQVLTDFGLVKRTRAAGSTYLDLPRDRILETLRKRFWSMPSADFNMTRLNQYPQVRRMLGIGNEDRHPPELLEDVIDWLISLGAKPEKTEILLLIWGSIGQIHDALVARFKRGDPVVLPKRTVKRHSVCLEDLRAVAHSTLKQAFRTALDPVRANPMMMPRPVDMMGVIANNHPVLQQIALVVAVAGQAMPQFTNLRAQACILLRDLDGPMTAANPANSADVRRVLEAQYILAMASQGSLRRRFLSNVACWPWVVTIFEAYRHQEGIPGDLADYLATIAPAMPQGNDDVIKRARRELDADTEKRYEDRAAEIGELLDNVSALYPELERRRNETKSFRRRVMELHERSQAWPMPVADWRVEGVHTTIDEHAPVGKRKRHIHFAIRSWLSIKKEVADATAGAKRMGIKSCKFYTHIPASEQPLFENNYVVQFIRCEHEDGTPADPPKWFGLFVDRVFWPTAQLTDTEVRDAFAVRNELGVTTSMLKNLAKGLGDFAGGKKALARHARRELDMVLLPLDEWDHLEAIALYAVSTRLDDPVRTSEHLGFNIGAGLDVHEGADGVNYTVFRSWRKKKPLIHDFMISRESELLTEEMLATTSRRKYGGGPIPPVAKSSGAGKRAAAFERYNLAYGQTSLDAARVDMAVVCMSWGIHNIGVVNFKYFWNKLAEEKGMTLAERRDAQGHVREDTTRIYNPPTPKQRRVERENRRDAIKERRQRILSQSSAPQYISTALTSLTERASELRQAVHAEPEGDARDALLREYVAVQAQITAQHVGRRLGAKVLEPTQHD